MGSRLNKRTFTTEDSRGCSFKGEVYTVRNYVGGPIVEIDYYYNTGNRIIHTKTLSELKTEVGKI